MVRPALGGETDRVATAGERVSIEQTTYSWWPLLVGGLAAAVFAGSGWWRLRRVPVRPWRFGPGTGLATFLLAALCGMIVSLVVAQVAGVRLDGDLSLVEVLPIMAGAWAGQILGASALPLVRRMVEGGPAHDRTMPRKGSVVPDRRRSRLAAAGVGVFGLILFWPMTIAAAMLAGVVWQQFTGEQPSVVAHDMLADLINMPPSMLRQVSVATLIVMPAVVEEVLYRGLLQESFRRARLFSSGAPWQSIVLASLVFTAFHVGSVDPHGLAGLFVLSLGFGWAYARTGRLTASITMHMAFNAGNIVLSVPW